MLNLGIIGLGIGAQHADGIVNTGKATVAAICDTNEQTLEKFSKIYPDAHASTDYRDMLSLPDIDGVIVASPDNFHRDMVCDALKAGKHVLCEKPIALHLDECKEMIEASKEYGKLLMVGQVCRVTPGFMLAKEIISSGMLGELYFIESEYAHDYAHIGGWRMDKDLKRHPVTGGGCHAVDLVRWLTGKEPTEAFSYSTHECLTDWPCDDTTISVLKFDKSLAGKIYISTGCKRDYTMRTAIYGTKGTVIVNNTLPYLSLYVESFEGKDTLFWSEMKSVEHRIPVEQNNHNFKAEIDEFCDCIINNTEPAISAEEGARAVAICEAIIRSSETGNPEKIEY